MPHSVAVVLCEMDDEPLADVCDHFAQVDHRNDIANVSADDHAPHVKDWFVD
jgi:hypothetical protein